MKKLERITLVTLLIAVLLWTAAIPCFAEVPPTYWTDYADTDWDGDGTESSPYLITSAAELAGLAKLVNGIPAPTSADTDPTVPKDWMGHANHFNGKYFKLTDDLDLSAHYWIPIGYDFMGGFRRTFCAFEGCFDGNEKEITGLKIDNTLEGAGSMYKKAIGLFGVVGGTGAQTYGSASDNEPASYYANHSYIKDLSVKGTINLKGAPEKGLFAGGLVAAAYSCDITNCSADIDFDLVKQTTESKYECLKVATLCGQVTEGSIIGCSSKGAIDANLSVNAYSDIHFGGIVGDYRAFLSSLTISGCTMIRISRSTHP